MSSRRILSMDVSVTSIGEVVSRVLSYVRHRQSAYVCVSNVHMCMEAFSSVEFNKVVNRADLVIPDGKPLSWAQKLLGEKQAEQVRGQDIMLALCSLSSKENLCIGLYGGATSELLEKAKDVLSSCDNNINIAYSYSPPFRPLTKDEDEDVVAAINAAEVDVLFVGIGCPKQEYWMAEHKERLNCVMLGVGAAFDFVAGEKRHAPRWLQKIGLEWLFRLLSEPKRLWRRYLTTNPRFIYFFLQQWLFGKKF